MTSEEKQLLIKDLCARLPYGVRGRDNEFDYENESKVVIGLTAAIDADDYLVHYDDANPAYLYADGFKPVLFPFSSISKDIEINGKRMNICRYLNLETPMPFRVDASGAIMFRNMSFLYPRHYVKVVNTFLEYHIDFHDLIKKGLATSVFDLPENPYK